MNTKTSSAASTSNHKGTGHSIQRAWTFAACAALVGALALVLFARGGDGGTASTTRPSNEYASNAPAEPVTAFSAATDHTVILAADAADAAPLLAALADRDWLVLPAAPASVVDVVVAKGEDELRLQAAFAGSNSLLAATGRQAALFDARNE
ncbi:MAG: hypothetical protein ABI782_11560 [Anaerolineaceae bacterium]